MLQKGRKLGVQASLQQICRASMIQFVAIDPYVSWGTGRQEVEQEIIVKKWDASE